MFTARNSASGYENRLAMSSATGSRARPADSRGRSERVGSEGRDLVAVLRGESTVTDVVENGLELAPQKSDIIRDRVDSIER